MDIVIIGKRGAFYQWVLFAKFVIIRIIRLIFRDLTDLRRG